MAIDQQWYGVAVGRTGRAHAPHDTLANGEVRDGDVLTITKEISGGGPGVVALKR